jgi:Xaa-Pro dipeptidase
LKVGRKYSLLDKDARTRLGKYKKFFIHSLGHGVGKKVHEKPIIASCFRKKKLTPKRLKMIEEIKNAKICVGDVITIEPGIYVKKKFGLRIEDTVFIRKNSVEVLTNSQKYLVIV